MTYEIGQEVIVNGVPHTVTEVTDNSGSENEDVKEAVNKALGTWKSWHAGHDDAPSFEAITEMIEHPVTEPKFNVSGAIAEAIAKFNEERRFKSFSERNPQLGPMAKCQICQKRHRKYLICVQVFALDYIEEDLETGEKTNVYRTAPGRGRTQYKGKRLMPHLSKPKLLFINRVRQLLDYDENTDLESPLFQAALTVARKKAGRQLRKEARIKRKRKNAQREKSRRINGGRA